MTLNKKFIITLVFIILLPFSIFSSGNIETTNEPLTKPVIAVSILPEKTFVEKIAGDTVNCIALIPPGASPENYEPSISERVQLANAVMYYTIGVNTEQSNILRLVDPNTKIISLANAVNKIYPDLTLDGGRDPHIWLSIKRVKVIVNTICDTLSTEFPSNSKLYKKNCENYLEELDSTANYLTNLFSNSSINTFLVYHPAFQYFADDYGLKMLAIETGGKEATVQGLENITNLAKKNNIKAIFYQQEIDSRQTEAIKNELGIKAVSLDPLSTNYTENLKTMALAIIGN